MTSSADLELLRKVCRRGMPPLPSPALRYALELVADEPTDNARLIDHLEHEGALRYSVLVLANIPMFAGQHMAKSVRQAVLQSGRAKCAGFLWVLALSDVLRDHADLQPRVRDKLWRHSLLTGMLAYRLAQIGSGESSPQVFAAGMAHDIGHLLMVNPAPRLGIVWHEEHDQWVERSPSLAPERDHCRLGGALMSFWHAPKELTQTALYHHDPLAAPAESASLVAGVRLADLLAEYIDMERPARRLHLESSPAWQHLRQVPPWNASPELDRLAVECLPEVLLATEHLTNLLAK